MLGVFWFGFFNDSTEKRIQRPEIKVTEKQSSKKREYYHPFPSTCNWHVESV